VDQFQAAGWISFTPPLSVANAHRRPIPKHVLAAAGTEVDPDRRITLMLGSCGTSVAPRGEQVENAV
jgi:hypothetical protein